MKCCAIFVIVDDDIYISIAFPSTYHPCTNVPRQVLGSAIALRILFGAPLWLGCIITVLDTFVFLLLHLYGVRKLEAFFLALVGVMAVAFCTNFFIDAPPPGMFFVFIFFIITLLHFLL